ncbi:MAG: radical SAM protein [Candidatus Krumholzibacteria bacterium]|nr:radical SAM protein [Candidatus Krumholzibacteria bacterium]
MPLPIDAVIAITYRCDSRCNMCNIWKLPPGDELTPEEFRNLPRTLRDINITGGEPFLRDDIVEVVRILDEHCNHPRIVISTNGFERRRIMHAAPLLMKIGRRIGLAVSLDGIGEKHDEIRGVSGGFDKVVETLKQLRTIGYRNVRVAFTAQRSNAKHLGAVYDLSRQVGYQFTASVAQNSEFYFSTGDNQTVDPLDLEGELRYVMRKELLSASPKRWLRAYFYAGVLRYNVSKERILACRAGRDSFFMDPEGSVYPCLTLNRSMGSVRKRSFVEIWNDASAAGVRSEVDRCKQPCWMICTARTAMLRRPHEPARWVLANWLRIVAGREVG